MRYVLGIDEVGRGCWAGPLVAGAVILRQRIPGLKDSKLLTALQRQHLAAQIQVEALTYGLGWVSPKEIDAWGLTEAVRVAMQRAIELITMPYRRIIIDGSFNFFPDNEIVEALPKADNLIPAVSAASIIAKVARDAYMAEVSFKYPEYMFNKHVGYGTPLHSAKLKQYGPCELHRRSYKPVQTLINSS